MAKAHRKSTDSLERRIESFMTIITKTDSKLKYHKPGSQNRNKRGGVGGPVRGKEAIHKRSKR